MHRDLTVRRLLLPHDRLGALPHLSPHRPLTSRGLRQWPRRHRTRPLLRQRPDRTSLDPQRLRQRRRVRRSASARPSTTTRHPDSNLSRMRPVPVTRPCDTKKSAQGKPSGQSRMPPGELFDSAAHRSHLISGGGGWGSWGYPPTLCGVGGRLCLRRTGCMLGVRVLGSLCGLVCVRGPRVLLA